MPNYFVTSFAHAENTSYAWRFHGDLAREVEEQTGGRIRAESCRGGQGDANAALVARAGVLVALCSPQYYADRGCGADWALFQHRLDLVPAQWRPAVPPARVLVRWLPADPPNGLPEAPVIGADLLDDYARRGLYGVMRTPGWNAGQQRRSSGWNSDQYRNALRKLAALVCAGFEHRPPALFPEDIPELPQAFPRAATVPPPRLAEPTAQAPVPPPREPTDGRRKPRVFISYAHEEGDDGAHERRVRALYQRMCEGGVDVCVDQIAPAGPKFWPRWMHEEYKKSTFVVVIASPAYKRRAEQTEVPGRGNGVAFEADYILQERYSNREWYRRILLVTFPGYSHADLPAFLGEGAVSYYRIDPDTGEGDLPDLLDYVLGRTS
jgi:hypothetical protein